MENLIGKRFEKLVVVEQVKSTASGQRQWLCRCDCGAITYKATDTLNNDEYSSCQKCAGKYAAAKAREGAGFFEGTQISKIKDMSPTAANTSGVQGVYFDKRQNKWRARLRFKGKIMSFGSFSRFEDAVFARKMAEKEYFGTFLEENDLNR